MDLARDNSGVIHNRIQFNLIMGMNGRAIHQLESCNIILTSEAQQQRTGWLDGGLLQ